jgi:hypothetical protein
LATASGVSARVANWADRSWEMGAGRWEGIGDLRLLIADCRFHLTPALLYLNFRLTLSVRNGLGRWGCPAACRRQDSGSDEFVALWHWSLAKCVGSLNRSCLCPKLEPLIERPSKASSHLQEGARTL